MLLQLEVSRRKYKTRPEHDISTLKTRRYVKMRRCNLREKSSGIPSDYVNRKFIQVDWSALSPTIVFLRPLIKRSMDITGSLVLLTTLLPAIITIAIVVAMDGGPVIYVSYRVGRYGKIFRCLKFRTMAPDADRRLAELLKRDGVAREEWENTVKLRRDPRITATGRLLRTSSLDELPQLVNVLVGEMSLVGPRPVPVVELEKYYGIHAREYVSVKPGLTGLWQVSGRSDASYERRVALDVAYVRNPSIRTDLLTLVRTVSAVLFGKGAC